MIRYFHRTNFVIASIFAFIVIIGTAQAQTAFNAGGPNGGAIIPGWAADSCNSGMAGAIRYNSGTSCTEFCNGSSWICPGSATPDCSDDATGECILNTTRSISDPEFSAANIANGVNILGITGTYEGPNCQIDPVVFIDVTNADFSQQYTSNTVTINGMSASNCYIAASFDEPGTLVVNGIEEGAYASISNGDTVALRMDSYGGSTTTVSATLYESHFPGHQQGDPVATWNIETTSCPAGAGTQTYSTAGIYSFNLPTNGENCTYTITVKGGGGSHPEPWVANYAGRGGGMEFEWSPEGAVAAFDILVGGGAQHPSNGMSGGYGGGGDGPSACSGSGGGGGGASGIKFDGTLIAVAGGGGHGEDYGSYRARGAPYGGSFNLKGQGGTIWDDDNGKGGGPSGEGGAGGDSYGTGGNGGDSTPTTAQDGGAGSAAGSGAGGTAIAAFGVSGGGGGLNYGGGSQCGGAGGGGYGGGGGGARSGPGGGGGGYLKTGGSYAARPGYIAVDGGKAAQPADFPDYITKDGEDGEVTISWGG